MSGTTSLPAAEIAKTARQASFTIKSLPGSDRDLALDAIYDALLAFKDDILAANAKDMEAAATLVAEGKLSQSLVKRLDLSRSGKYEDMLQGIKDVRGLEDPVGKTTLATKLDDNLTLHRYTTPIGTLLIIFEARPEVIANISSLAIKSGNAAILKGGKESSYSFAAIASVISEALSSTRIPPGAIQLVQSREAVKDLLDQDVYIDLVIPRGGNDLVRYIKDNTKIPVMGHADGLCSTYVHEDADVKVAVDVVVDGKTDYPAACNATETLIVHKDVLGSHLPSIAKTLQEKGVSIRCDERSLEILKAVSEAEFPAYAKSMLQLATEQDFNTEFLDLTIAVKTVDSLQEAVAHINSHSSSHTDAIVTTSKDSADLFCRMVDSAGVYVNASTRFADGYRYGFGTEVGISTNKVHARGPVGLEGLMIYKYVIRGEGHTVTMYGGEGGKKYLHEKIEF
ncbi:hypothetical protein EYR41_011127 [Orbilia oligospora]|uniref:glutamate-5-semialdehyde dehydrogenase n=1 Tax=Orbilia oligospora TaxID=2813651 RepID=A0A7C8PNX6_ORBOL|nr:hypothetical protein TWF751_003455 [Orbilia oligospora]TGJ63190.1 hypothetical protein EYR41_011127 [Orbilia oligospora]